MMNLFSGRAFLLLLMLFLLPFSFSPAYSQEDMETSFRVALEKALKELEQVRERRSAARTAFESRLRRLRSEREELAASLKEAEIRLEDLDGKEESLAKNKSNREEELANLQMDLRGVEDFLFRASENLNHWIRSSPYHPGREKQMNEFRLLKEGWKKGEALEELFSLAEREARLGETVSLFQGIYQSSEGNNLEADFIRAGRIGNAFRIRDNGVMGLSLLRQPTPAGLRWTEEIGWLTQQRLNSLFDGLRSGKEGLYHLPLDVTQRFRFSSFGKEDLMETLVSGGVIMIPLLLIALVGLFLMAERCLFLRREKRGTPDSLVREVIALWHGDRHEHALECCRTSRGPLARILEKALCTGVRKRKEMENALQEAMLREIPRLERFLSAIGIMAAISPLLGLLGTVTGMIGTFRTITLYGTGDPRLLSGGISQALITTQVGLLIAIPLLLFHGYLSGRIDQLTNGVEKGAVAFLNGMGHKVESAEARSERGGEVP